MCDTQINELSEFARNYYFEQVRIIVSSEQDVRKRFVIEKHTDIFDVDLFEGDWFGRPCIIAKLTVGSCEVVRTGLYNDPNKSIKELIDKKLKNTVDRAIRYVNNDVRRLSFKEPRKAFKFASYIQGSVKPQINNYLNNTCVYVVTYNIANAKEKILGSLVDYLIAEQRWYNVERTAQIRGEGSDRADPLGNNYEYQAICKERELEFRKENEDELSELNELKQAALTDLINACFS